VFLSLAPIPLFALTGDEAAALRIASLILGAVLVIDLAMLTPSWRRDWPDDPGLYAAWLIGGSNAFLGFANVAWGSTGVYELALGLVLLWPSSIFIRVLRET
jgi:hypothetical protein